MPLEIATHSGPFHADDVLATAMLQEFVDGEATVVRSRDPERLNQADIVLDVGGVFDPAKRRFDHHQHTYEGPRSSAGMVLDWLSDTGAVSTALADSMRTVLVDYVDDVDNGRREPQPGVPCFAWMVETQKQRCRDHTQYDAAFADAVRMAREILVGLQVEFDVRQKAEKVIVAAMAAAEAKGTNLLELDDYIRWKPGYFSHGGSEHPTEFVIFPGIEDDWRIIAIPPKEHSFANKVSLPEAWAGLTDEALEEATGVPGAKFCHKNRFIAVFKTRAGALQALEQAGLLVSTHS